ncbi:hypothetical protein ACHAXN_009062 [Cyclotella atomus]
MASFNLSTMKRSFEGFTVAIASALACIHHQADGRNELTLYRQRSHPAFFVPTRSSSPRIFLNHRRNSAICESVSAQNAANLFPVSKDNSNYIKLNPDHVERTALQDTHALFGTLYGEGFIERYDVYRRLDDTNTNTDAENISNETTNKKEMVAVDLQIGHRLNGHDKIVHGGILSLLIDEAMGWASYIGLEHYNSNMDEEYKPSNTLLVTANLNIDFRAPFLAGSQAVLRVYLDQELTAGRKMYLVARLESFDGSVIFAEAKSLFLCVPSEKMKGVMN